MKSSTAMIKKTNKIKVRL